MRAAFVTGAFQSRLAFRLAEEADAAALVELRDAAARWMVSRGIDQWQPGTLSEDHFRGRMRDGEVWLATDGVNGDIVGAWELWWSDDNAWGSRPPVAGYVHRLMIDRGNAPRGLGRLLLSAAEDRIVASGRSVARLDCAAHNLRLQRYYLDLGYREVGHQPLCRGSRYPVTLFEKHLPAARLIRRETAPTDSLIDRASRRRGPPHRHLQGNLRGVHTSIPITGATSWVPAWGSAAYSCGQCGPR